MSKSQCPSKFNIYLKSSVPVEVMGKLLAVVLAFVLTCSGYQIFRETAPIESGPLLSLYIFMISIFLLLYDLRLYPSSLRKLDGFGQTFIEFLVAAFVMENMMLDFWIPLLSTITKEMVPDFADFVDETLQKRDWNCFEFCNFMKSVTFVYIISYTMSTFFLIAVLHAIRAIDLRALQDGPSCFVGDIFFRAKRSIRRKLRSLGLGGRKRVKIRENADDRIVAKRNRSNLDAQYNKNKNPCLVVDGEHDNEYGGRNYENDDIYQPEPINDSSEDFSEFDMANDLYHN